LQVRKISSRLKHDTLFSTFPLKSQHFIADTLYMLLAVFATDLTPRFTSSVRARLFVLFFFKIDFLTWLDNPGLVLRIIR
jgi:hypothetical protein